jgi:hypothetical protein
MKLGKRTFQDQSDKGYFTKATSFVYKQTLGSRSERIRRCTVENIKKRINETGTILGEECILEIFVIIQFENCYHPVHF